MRQLTRAVPVLLLSLGLSHAQPFNGGYFIADDERCQPYSVLHLPGGDVRYALLKIMTGTPFGSNELITFTSLPKVGSILALFSGSVWKDYVVVSMGNSQSQIISQYVTQCLKASK
ncbi:hypothetical protein [Deinococcus multiflagellatus]|uniref:Uncharacterized protein n=1 Tax=Deinococcus multiflagellatus TaxID=1656887 RepID=A0ABW1ZNG1_9DEIO|nr:hypothetical protein [Deinococcus multiflagellatus]MBZ9715233.1 hypothetical protein [Deinococcus multiflagellatus]